MTRTPRLRLGIDLDGVLANFNSGWIERYNREFGTHIVADEVDMWNSPTLLTHFAKMSEFWQWARTAGDGASIFRVLEPYPGAIEATERLARHHDIVIVTTKPSFAIHDTFEWLAEHRVPTREVHIVDDKTTVACDVYLDDADHNLIDLAAAHPAALVCRYVRPWGHPQPGVVDVIDFPDFEQNVNLFLSQFPTR